jgi:acetoacetate decarboxylase
MSFVKTPNEVAALMGRTYDFYEAELLAAYWLTRPEIVERLLPPPLEPVDEPLAYAFVADYPRTNFGPPYREGALFLAAQYEGVRGDYCLAMPVTGDMAMAGGREEYGFPKKIAKIAFNKEDDQVRGSLERHGQPFFFIAADLNQPTNDANLLSFFGEAMAVDDDGTLRAIFYNFKYFTAPDKTGFDYRPRLVRQTTLLRPHTMLFGRMDVSLPPADCDPWHEVEVVQPLGAIYTVGNNQMLAGEVVAEVDGPAFAPYAFLKWDT